MGGQQLQCPVSVLGGAKRVVPKLGRWGHGRDDREGCENVVTRRLLALSHVIDLTLVLDG